MLVQQQIDALFAGAIAHGAGVAKEVPAQAPTMKRCNRTWRKSQCNHWFSISDNRKLCSRCRKTALKAVQTKKGKENVRRAQSNEKGKASHKRYRQSAKRKVVVKRWYGTPKGKACTKRQNDRPMSRLAGSLGRMLAGTHDRPATFPKLGIFANNAEVQAHFGSTFAPWMAWENLGKRRKSTLPNTRWQLGHRIPKVWYRHDDLAEIKKAWSRANLFAQCAVENTDANDRNILTREQWLSLKAIWPKQCAQMTEDEAWIWARDNVDNATRKAQRKAAAGPSDLNATFETESDDSD
jgi:hypothetical protein